jgi:hypothetical protein
MATDGSAQSHRSRAREAREAARQATSETRMFCSVSFGIAGSPSSSGNWTKPTGRRSAFRKKLVTNGRIGRISTKTMLRSQCQARCDCSARSIKARRIAFDCLGVRQRHRFTPPPVEPKPAAPPASREVTESVTGKYRPLHAHLIRAHGDELTMTFEEIEHVLGTTLPPSAYNHRAWWGNEDPYKTVLRGKRSWLFAGFKAYPDMRLRRVTFKRASSAIRGGSR